MSYEELIWWFCLHHLRYAHPWSSNKHNRWCRVPYFCRCLWGVILRVDEFHQSPADVAGLSFISVRSDAVASSCLHLFVVNAAPMHTSFCIFAIDGRWWGQKLYLFCRPGKLIPGCQSLWHVKHLHNPANMAFNLCSRAELSFYPDIWRKIATETSSSCGVFKMDKELDLAEKPALLKTTKTKKIALFLEARQWNRNPLQ